MSLFSRFWRNKKTEDRTKIATSTAQMAQISPTSNPIPYALPNDMREVNRLDFQHYMLRYVLQGNYLAPLDAQDPSLTMLDVGCGNGRWLYEMAQQFPSATLFGLDQAPLPATPFIASRYFKFVQHNALQPLPFPEASFSYVHQRLLVLALPVKFWAPEVAELIRVTRRGGWVELVESDGFFSNSGPAIRQLNEYGHQTLKQRGIEPLQVRNIKLLLESNGLQHIQFQPVSVPVGAWGGRLGQMALSNTQVALEGMKPLILNAAGISSAALDGLLQQVYEEFERNNSSMQFFVVCGQRP